MASTRNINMKNDYCLEQRMNSEICNDRKAVDVHHIKYQCTADENNLIDGKFHKNEEYNLTSLCKECHQDVHKDLIKIDGYKISNEGRVLVYNKV